MRSPALEQPGSEELPIEFELGGNDALPEFVDVLEEAGEWLFARGVSQWPPGSNRAQEPLLRGQLRNGTLLLARAAGRLAGGCLLTRDRYEAWANHPGESAYLHKLVVARFAAGQGLGERIVREAEGWARAQNLSRMRLDCWEGNVRLRTYYRELRYRELATVAEHGYEVRLFEKDLSE